MKIDIIKSKKNSVLKLPEHTFLGQIDGGLMKSSGGWALYFSDPILGKMFTEFFETRKQISQKQGRKKVEKTFKLCFCRLVFETSHFSKEKNGIKYDFSKCSVCGGVVKINNVERQSIKP